MGDGRRVCLKRVEDGCGRCYPNQIAGVTPVLCDCCGFLAACCANCKSGAVDLTDLSVCCANCHAWRAFTKPPPHRDTWEAFLGFYADRTQEPLSYLNGYAATVK